MVTAEQPHSAGAQRGPSSSFAAKSGNAWQYRCTLLDVATPHLCILVHHGTQHFQGALPVSALYTGNCAVQQGTATLRVVVRQHATLCADLQDSTTVSG